MLSPERPDVVRSSNREKIILWLTETLERDQRVDRIELRHIAVDDRTRPVQSWQLSGVQDPEGPAMVGDQIAAAAAEDAEGLGGVQRYLCLAYVREECISSRPIREAPAKPLAWTPGDAIDSHPPTDKGIVAYALNHLENTQRTLGALVGGVSSLLLDEVKDLRARNSHLERRHWTMIEAHEAAISKKHERKQERRVTDAKIAQRQELINVALQLLPHIANKAFGKAILPEKTSPALIQFRQLMQTVTPEALEGLRFVLTPIQYKTMLDIAQEELFGEGASDDKPQEKKTT